MELILFNFNAVGKIQLGLNTIQEIDLIATLPHEPKLSVRDVIEVKLHVDLFGNGKVMLPQRNKPVTCKAQVAFG
jgi:hypothetical protein